METVMKQKPRNTVVRHAMQRSWGAGVHQKSHKALRQQEKIKLRQGFQDV